jgi:hypothetical protein
MNTVPIMRPGSIAAIGGLASQPAYFLKLNGPIKRRLVVQGEAADITHAPASVASGRPYVYVSEL